MAQRNDAGRVHPVHEQAPAVVRPAAAAVEQQPVEVAVVVAAEPAPQGQVLRLAHHLQGVDLHPPDPLDGGVHVIGGRSPAAPQRFSQPLRMQRQCPHRRQRIHGFPIGSCFDPDSIGLSCPASTGQWDFRERRATGM